MDGKSGSGWQKCWGVAMLSLNHLYGHFCLEMSMAILLWLHGFVLLNASKDGEIIVDAKVRGRLHGRDERVVRALKMFILFHSWAPAEDILCWLGFVLALDWAPSIVVLAWQEGGMWEILCPCHSPSHCKRKCLLNEPIPESLAFQINK